MGSLDGWVALVTGVAAALWLAGPAAGYVTGCRLNVSGGLELD